MGLLDNLLGGGSAADSTATPSTSMPDFLTSPATGDFLSALGAGLLTGDRYNWIGPGFQQQLQVNAKNADARQTRGALKAALKAMGFSDEDAEKFSFSKDAAELVAAQKQQQTAAAQTNAALAGAPSLGGLIGGGTGGGATNLGMGSAPRVPAGSGAGSGGGQIPGSLSLDDNNVDVAVRTALAEAGNQGPEGLKAVAGTLRNRALLAGTSVADEALKPSQYEPWNDRSGNDPRRFRVDSPEYQAAKEAILPVLRGEALDPTGGATHFYAPKAQAALGRAAPQWDDGSGVDIGDHRFFRLPYAGRDPSALAQAQSRAAPAQTADASGAVPLPPFVPAPGGGADNPDPSNPVTGFGAPPANSMPVPMPGRGPAPAPAVARRPVQVAGNEQDVQRLEGQMSMYPPNVYGVTPETQRAGMPSPSPRPTSVVGGNTQPSGAPTSPARSLADTDAADRPVPDAQPAEFRIPPGPARPDAMPNASDQSKQAVALAHYGYWTRVLAQSGTNKSLAEVAKANMDLSKEYLKPDQIERKLDAAGITGQERQDIIRRSFSDSRPAEVQKYEYGRANPGFAEYEARLKDPSSKISADIEARKAGAEALGLKPGSAAYQSYTLTGKMPREDQQPLSATDKKAIMEADEGVLGGQAVIDNLRQAKDLSKKAYAGPLASARGYGMSFLNSEAGQATVDLDNLVTTNALGQLKSTFGAAPTEGERKILLEIQGSSNLPDAARQKIYDRAIALAEKRLEFNRQRAADLRGQTYYKPDGGAAGSRAGGAPSPAAPSFATPDLEAEARRRGLIQ